MRMLLLALAAAVSLALSACGGSEEKTVIVPAGNAVVVPGDAKVCQPGERC